MMKIIMPKVAVRHASAHRYFHRACSAAMLSTSAFVVCATPLVATHVHAQTVWYGTNSSRWSSPSNWVPATVPDSNENTYIAAADPNNQPILDGFVGTGVGLTRDVFIGFDGTDPNLGVLTIQNGGVLNSSGDGLIGFSVGAVTGEGRVIVQDTGSQWRLPSNILTVGYTHEGTLTIRDGGKVESYQGRIGSATNGVGIVNIWRTGSAWNLTSDIVIGESGRGELTISDNGQVTSSNGVLGLNSTGRGAVTVAGTGTKFTAANNMFVGVKGEGELTVSYGGEVEIASAVGEVKLADDANSKGTLNIGAASGDPAAEAGTLNAPSVAFGNGEGTLVFNHINTGYIFSADLSGYGTILHEAGETTYTGTGGLLSGETKVSGGRLLVNGFLGGMTTVNGGVLGGSGNVLDVAVNSGGTLAPGNSIGTLTADNATFNAGSVFEVELNNGGNTKGVNNDLLDVTFNAGNLVINGGTIHVKPENGTDDGSSYTPGLTYTIIEANDRTGEFDQVVDDFPLLTFTDIYSGANVYLQSAAASTCPGGMTFNQTNTCGGVLSVGSGGMYNAVVNLTGSELPDALDQLSGEIHASVKGALMEESRFPREAANARIRSAFGAVASNPAPVLAYGDDRELPPMAPGDRGLAMWARGFGSVANWDGDGNAADAHRSTGGLLFGADGFVTDRVNLGLLGGYSRSSIDVDARNSTATADNWHLGVYGGGEWGGFGLRGGGIYSWHDIDTSRSPAFRGFSDTLSSSYDARTAQIFAETSYRFDTAAASFEPYAGIAHVRLATNGYSEAGGEASLSSADAILKNTFTTLGLRAETEVEIGDDAMARLSGGIGWRHAIGGVTPTTIHAFAGGDNFTAAGVPIARDALVLDIGADFALSEMANLSVSYSGQLAGNAADHGVELDLSIAF